MPIEYTIESERGVVFTTVAGDLTVADILAHFKQLSADRDYRPHFDGLSDFTAAVLNDATGEDLRRLALALPLTAPARRAIVVSNDLHFAFGRMVEMNRSTPGIETRVFRSRAEAEQWLGLS